MTELRMPTNLGIIGGRTSVSGPEDYPAVRALQDQYRLVPLQAWGTDWAPPAEVPVQPGVDTATPVPRQVLPMGPEVFLGRLNALLPANPPYPADAPVMQRIAQLGITPGAGFPWASSRLACRRRSPGASRLASRRSAPRKRTWASTSTAGR